MIRHRLAARNQNLRMRLSCALRAAGGFTSSGPVTIPDPFKTLFRKEGFRQENNSSRKGGFAPERLESWSWFPETSRSDKSSSQAEFLECEPSKVGQIVGSFFGEIFPQL